MKARAASIVSAIIAKESASTGGCLPTGIMETISFQGAELRSCMSIESYVSEERTDAAWRFE
jgi:hypothetical protein